MCRCSWVGWRWSVYVFVFVCVCVCVCARARAHEFEYNVVMSRENVDEGMFSERSGMDAP